MLFYYRYLNDLNSLVSYHQNREEDVLTSVKVPGKSFLVFSLSGDGGVFFEVCSFFVFVSLVEKVLTPEHHVTRIDILRVLESGQNELSN